MATNTKEVKKKNNKKPAKKKGNYFKGVWSELKKVHWPNRKELTVYTSVVLGIVVFATVIIWIADLIISAILNVIV